MISSSTTLKALTGNSFFLLNLFDTTLVLRKFWTAKLVESSKNFWIVLERCKSSISIISRARLGFRSIQLAGVDGAAELSHWSHGPRTLVHDFPYGLLAKALNNGAWIRWDTRPPLLSLSLSLVLRGSTHCPWPLYITRFVPVRWK